MIHRRLIFRQLTEHNPQRTVFFLCVVLSMITIAAVNGFSDGIRHSLLRDARSLHAADVIIRSHFPVSQPIVDAVAEMEKQGRIQSVRTYEFYSMVHSDSSSENQGNQNEKDLLADIKIVEPDYPFYGEVILASGRPFSEVLTEGSVIAEPVLLDRLGLKVGDRLKLGKSVLTIADVVLREPDRPVQFLSFGPRVFVSDQDRARLGLMQPGSRVRYRILLKKISGTVEKIASEIRERISEGQERVETYRSARSRVQRFFDNFLFFLAVIAIFTLLLSGIGIHSALTAFLKEREKTIAVFKAMGAPHRFIFINFMTVAAVMGTAGTLTGIALGIGLQYLVPVLLGNLLPQDMTLVLSWRTIAESLCLGLGVTFLFGFLPIHRLKEIRPVSVFRNDENTVKRGAAFYAAFAAILFFLSGMIFWQLEDVKVGLWFVGGMAGLVLMLALLSQIILSILRRIRPRSLILRQALRGLFRPGNAARVIIVTLSASLAVIFSIYLLEENLDAAFVRSYPPDAPNLFFIDIQPDQVKPLSDELGQTPLYYPIIRSRLESINGKVIERKKERRRRGDNLARPFNLTYRDELLEDEALTEGESMFRNDWSGLQVSVLDHVVKIRPIKVGDRLKFKIQGVPVEARVSSIRTRTRESVKPFFYFVFPADSLLKDAPQSIFTAIRVPPKQVGAVQHQVTQRFPNISVIDIGRTITVFADIMHRLSRIIRGLTFFSVMAGILMIVSSVFATRFTRTREAVYFKILGADSRFVRRMFSLENLITGTVSAVLALMVSHTASLVICTKIFDISYQPFLSASLLMFVLTPVLVTGVGLTASQSILKRKPVEFLREQTEG